METKIQDPAPTTSNALKCLGRALALSATITFFVWVIFFWEGLAPALVSFVATLASVYHTYFLPNSMLITLGFIFLLLTGLIYALCRNGGDITL